MQSGARTCRGQLPADCPGPHRASTVVPSEAKQALCGIKASAEASADHHTTLAKELAPVGTSVGVLSLTAVDEAYMAKGQHGGDAEVVLPPSVHGKIRGRSVEIAFFG